MSNKEPVLLVTGAAGKLGRLAIAALLETVSPNRIRAAARRPEALDDLAARGVDVRAADYERPETLDAAFAGADRILLISGSEVGKREPQHRNAIAAAKRAGAAFVAYTSILNADTSTMKLAAEHRATERELERSGIPVALLRNGWYFENDTASIPAMLANGAAIGASADGRISAAARADYARAAARILASSDGNNVGVYELAGDSSFTKAELALEVSRQSGTAIAYRNLPEHEYAKALESFGLPVPVAAMLADSDIQTAHGALFNDSRTLSRLIGRSTTTLGAAVAQALADSTSAA